MLRCLSCNLPFLVLLKVDQLPWRVPITRRLLICRDCYEDSKSLVEMVHPVIQRMERQSRLQSRLNLGGSNE